MPRKFLRYFAPVMLMALLLSLGGCAANGELRANAKADNTVAVVGDYEIPYENLYFLAMNQIADMKAVYGEAVFDDPAKVAELKTFVAENLFSYTEAMILVGLDYGIDVEGGDLADEVQSSVDTMMQNQFENDRQAYIDMLNKGYMTDHYLRTYLAVSEYLTEDILQKMLTSGEIDNSDAHARELIYGENFTHVYQVFIDPTLSRLTDEQALARAEQLRAQVAATATEERMSAMRTAIQYSLAMDDGSGLYIARGEMDREFDAAAFALDENYGVSEVMALNGGYCFVMRAPLDDTYVSAHFEELKQKSYYVYLNQKAEAYINGATLEWTEFGAELDLLNLPVLEADGGEWVNTLIAALIIGAVVIVIALLVKFLPDKDKKKSKKKAKK